MCAICESSFHKSNSLIIFSLKSKNCLKPSKEIRIFCSQYSIYHSNHFFFIYCKVGTLNSELGRLGIMFASAEKCFHSQQMNKSSFSLRSVTQNLIKPENKYLMWYTIRLREYGYAQLAIPFWRLLHEC